LRTAAHELLRAAAGGGRPVSGTFRMLMLDMEQVLNQKSNAFLD
jgi:hypothetical protein